MGKNILITFACVFAAIAVVVFIPSIFSGVQAFDVNDVQEGMFAQEVIRTNTTTAKINRFYANGQYIGVISDEEKLNQHLKDVYNTQYADQYPNSACHLGRNVYVVEEESYFTFSNVDDQIIQYLDQNQMYTLEATAITFSNESGEYAELYVSDEKIYQEAMNQYISFFIDPASLSSLQNGNTISDLTSYGTKDVGVSIAQTITTEKKNASVDEIKTTVDEVLTYLEYGDNTEREYYTVQEFDTVAGVGSKNYGLSAKQIMNINHDQITSTDQVLSAGMQLCITYFESPIDITVTRQTLKQEPIYFSTVTQEDDSLLVNTTQLITSGQNGSQNALYTEHWVNGVLTGGSLKSSVEIQQPVNEIVAVGTMQPSYVGTGSFRYPVDNATITCGWGCYYGHRGTDIADAYDRWGDVYAADNGTVIEVSYNSVNGNYIMIDHNNGYVTYYGHMRVPSELQVGDVVQKGDVIGHIGMTGQATGPHVHFYITYNGERQNACEVSAFPSCEAIGG